MEHTEAKAVVRISKRLIDEVVTQREVVASMPYNVVVLGFHCEGVAHGRGKLAVDLRTAQGDATFFVNSQGTVETHTRGVRGPIVALGSAWGLFTSQTLVRFDGRKFCQVKTTPWVQMHGKLDKVAGRHGGPVGRALGFVPRPLGQMLVPLAEREAKPIGEYYLKTFVDELAEKIISLLNRTTSLHESLDRLFPESKGWEFQLSTDPAFIQAVYGPPGIAEPTLPENPGRFEDTRLEVWLRATTRGAEALDKLTKQPLARQLVQKYLEATLPELAALAEERTVTAIGQWVVIGIGPPKATDLVSPTAVSLPTLGVTIETRPMQDQADRQI
jgi:hypothetical protein